MSAARNEAVRRIGMIHAAIGADLRASENRRGDTYYPPNTYASSRKKCLRQMALDLTNPEDREPADDNGLARMDRGNQRERSISITLQRAGERCEIPFEVIEGQKRFEITDRDGAIILTGKIDGKLKFKDGVKATFDCKAGESFRYARTVEDLLYGNWTWGSVWQLCAYLLKEGEEFGYLVLDRSGLPELVPVALEDHLGETEAFLQEARVAYNWRHKLGPLPDYTENKALCRFCSHAAKSCVPPALSSGGGVVLLSDETLIEAAEQREKHEEAAKAHARADAVLKKGLRGVEHAILGPFEVLGQWQKATTYDVPDEVKAPYKNVDPKGKFKLTVERLL